MYSQSPTVETKLDAQPAPPRGKKFPCHNCGAGLEYSPGAERLVCPYCGGSQEIPQSASEIRELAYHDYFRMARVPQVVAAGGMLETRCQACGGICEVPASVATDSCSFCGKHIDNPVTAPEPMLKPQGVLPFKVEYREAQSLFDKWVASRWFAPNNLKKLARLGRLLGLYVPYWTYDSMTYSFYTGQRGEHYWVTVRDSKGHTRQERRTRWYPASGRVNHFFDDVLVCASRGVPNEMIYDLEPWDLGALVDVAPDYLAGFRTERYQLDPEHGFTVAQGIMDTVIRQLVRRDIGGDEQRIHSLKTQHDAVTFKHILLPVWMAVYNYHQKTYRILVNARTGEVCGERPYSWIKITLFVLMIIAIATPIVMFIAENQ